MTTSENTTPAEPTTPDKPKKPLHERFLDMWFAPVSPSRFNLFIRAFTFTFILWVLDWGQWATEWLTNVGYHTPAKYTTSVYPTPLEPLDPSVLPFFLIVTIGAPLVVIFGPAGGWVRRIALFICSACALSIQLIDINSAFTLTKLYIVFFLFSSLAPDAKLVKVEGYDEPQWRISAWNMRIVQTTLLIQYSTAGICKAFQGAWLSHPDILYGHSAGLYRNWLATWCLHNLPRWFWVVQTFLALSFEMFAPVFFLIRKLRPLAFILGIGMHIIIAALMKDLILFSQQMFMFYILFLPYAWTDKAEDWWMAQRSKVLDKIIPGRRRA